MSNYPSHRPLSLAAFFLCSLFVLLSACSSPSNPQGNAGKGNGTPIVKQTASATSPTTSPTTSATSPATSPTATTPQAQTSCPAAGTARAAVMPSMVLGKDQNIVYISNTVGGTSAFLKRVDVQTKAITTILSQPGKTIDTAQISHDGQWILFSDQLNNTTSAMQLVRMDGQYLQTLYCTSTNQQYPMITMQWSPDQRTIIFHLEASGPLYLLQLASGSVQVEMSFSAQDPTISPATWIDNTRVYVTSGFALGNGVTHLYILDTGKGYNQHASDLQLIKSDRMGFGFDNSYDGSKLFILSNDTSTSGGSTIKIEAMSTNGANNHTIFSGFQNKGLLFPVLTIGYSSASIVFILAGGNGTTGMKNNGLWKINADGTGLTNISRDSTGPWNRYSQNPWSNFSRNGSFYATDGFYGSFSGGSISQYTNDSNHLVGWTTI